MQLHMFWALYIHAADHQGVKEDWEKQREVFGDLQRLRELFWNSPVLRDDLALRHVPELAQTLEDYCTRGAYDEFWAAKENDFTRFWHEHADIPATMTTGWYDPFPHADSEYWAAMAAKNEAPQRLIIGPWSHVGMRGDGTWTLDVDYGPTSRLGRPALLRRAARVLQPLAARRRERAPGGRGAGEDLRDGRRQRPQDRARQARPRRPLARRAGVAARACDRADAPSPRRRLAPRRRACGRRRAAAVHLRPRRSRADDRRALLRRRRDAVRRRGARAGVGAPAESGADAAEHHDPGRRRPEGVGRVLHGARAVPAPVRAR